jgi:hypothetical protein
MNYGSPRAIFQASGSLAAVKNNSARLSCFAFESRALGVQDENGLLLT